MKLGVAEGPMPYDPGAIDSRVGLKLAELGFVCVGSHLGYGLGMRPEELTTHECERIRATLAGCGVAVAQSWAWGANLVEPDDGRRQAALDVARAALRVARDLGARSVITGSGSVNPRGSYWPHPENFSPETTATLVRSLEALAPSAEEEGVVIALEGHVLTTLRSPAVMREVIDAIGSPWVRANLDPVNFVSDLPTLYRSTELIDETFDQLADVAIAGHLKDVYAEDRLVLHLSEAPPGQGVFDLAHYVRRFEAALPEAPMLIEHLPEELVPLAKRYADELLSGF